MIDIHSHILPGIDDGSKNMEMTLEMLRNAERDGTKEIVATPHYLLEYGEATINEVKLLVKEVNSLIDKEGLNIKIYSGQEVYFNENIIENFMEGNIGTINDSRYMLIEFPMHRFDKNIFETLYELQVRNIVPIIAHPERYKPFREQHSLINDFIEEGYLFQMNAGSIEGKFGEGIKKTANLFLENNIYNFMGSDAHNIENRNTGLQKAINILNEKSKNNKKINEHIFEDSSKKLLENDLVKFIGKKVKIKKSIFSFLKI
ncbi:MAG: capsular biosynthesis protein [Clostridium sp.]|uniref:tyrosine-protein phosphatase n=1 Tax=Clostridium sp. TaxID=1506 RepID=UPI0025C11353|nr:CpsB/CapC family capsule biosynthesis tyrosine phosphatase [Clostridium sp.]MCE5221481.1 capsular biosynthesis protein [Clostridium sp.]